MRPIFRYTLSLLSLVLLALPLSGQSIRVVKTNYKHERASWSPVEDLILFDSDIEGIKSIYIMDSKGNKLRRITSLDYEDSFGSWSPDGQKILYQSKRDDQYHLMVYDLVNNTEKKLATSNYITIAGNWSNDGRKIAYSARIPGGNNREIFLMDADGQNRERLTKNPRIDVIPVFSADDKRLFYQSNRDSENGRYDIYTIDLQTREIERITTHPSGDTDPFIYPVNNMPAFFSGRSDEQSSEGGMFYVNLTTRKFTRIPIKAWGHGHPTWSYDGRYMAIASPAFPRLKGEIHIYDTQKATTFVLTDISQFRSN